MTLTGAGAADERCLGVAGEPGSFVGNVDGEPVVHLAHRDVDGPGTVLLGVVDEDVEDLAEDFP